MFECLSYAIDAMPMDEIMLSAVLNFMVLLIDASSQGRRRYFDRLLPLLGLSPDEEDREFARIEQALGNPPDTPPRHDKRIKLDST